jgi:[ribosomal protein S18]-alanine N-acetyltransferase
MSRRAEAAPAAAPNTCADTGPISLRRARAADIAAMAALEAGVFAHGALTGTRFAYLLHRPSAEVLLARIKATLVGHVVLLFRRGSASARIYSLAVGPAARRCGVGRHLLHAAATAARRQGCNRLHLEVRADNLPAQRLYLSHGGTTCGTVPGYYEDGMCAIRMILPLPVGDAVPF